MARLKTTKSIDDKILECEEKLRKLNANFPGIVILNLISYITKLGFPL